MALQLSLGSMSMDNSPSISTFCIFWWSGSLGLHFISVWKMVQDLVEPQQFPGPQLHIGWLVHPPVSQQGPCKLFHEAGYFGVCPSYQLVDPACVLGSEEQQDVWHALVPSPFHLDLGLSLLPHFLAFEFWLNSTLWEENPRVDRSLSSPSAREVLFLTLSLAPAIALYTWACYSTLSTDHLSMHRTLRSSM